MRITVIINRHASRRCAARVESLLKDRPCDREFEVWHTNAPGHATALARRAVARGTDMVVAVGGDGTVNAVVNGAVRTDVTVGIIPVGSANDCALHHGIPRDPEKAWSVILDHDTRQIDAISANGWIFVTGGGIGLPCDVARDAAARRYQRVPRLLRRLGLAHGVYTGALAHRLISDRLPSHRIVVNNSKGRREIDVVALVVSNQPAIGRYFRPSRQADATDGQCDVCVIHNAGTRARVATRVIRAALGIMPAATPHLDRWCARELQLHCATALPFMGDGEVRAPQSHWAIRVLPGAIRLAVPKGREC